MTAQVLDGKATAAEIRREIATAVEKLERPPGLATLLVGDDPGSAVYVRNKHKACAEVGFNSVDKRLPADCGDADVHAAIDELNADPTIDGFIVQLPLPDGLDERAALERVDPSKDADGLHPVNLGRLVLGNPGPLPCTPKGILTLGERFGLDWAGSLVAVVGRGTTVGRPLGLLLTLKGIDATVTLCHSRTKDLAARTSEADVVVVAAGRAGLLTADMVRPGAAVFDVGLPRTEDGIAGDVAPEVRDVAAWLAPVPGGVGPMTIAMLLSNTLDAARRNLA
ncbi:MAG: bifunctional methylenetetrahydrofolate dehydrogenase/methenyltetrahydrofolate cyclohydrolase [Actinobacteria bacterium ATB1]|nr:bifunctional methylenetetrahydrofolate dehydrogenase/methenyltetrahydrofolate cyclohydrolase [Actinobacteria bacterium ATB1]